MILSKSRRIKRLFNALGMGPSLNSVSKTAGADHSDAGVALSNPNIVYQFKGSKQFLSKCGLR